MPGSLPPPLGGPAPQEVPLSRSPLVRVVAQARFSKTLKIDSQDGMVPFQERIGSEYPLLDQTLVPQLQVDFGGPSAPPFFRPISVNVWRFSNADRSWLLSLTSDAVTLETREYSGRSDFLPRWQAALANVERVFAPTLALRLGVRYINRIQDESLTDLTKWVRGSLIGVAQPELRDYVTQAISEANMTIEEGASLMRWGIMSPNTTVDPALLEPVPYPSWILDLDVSSGQQKPFSGETLAGDFRTLAERAYAIFRYAITDDGLAHFGAQL